MLHGLPHLREVIRAIHRKGGLYLLHGLPPHLREGRGDQLLGVVVDIGQAAQFPVLRDLRGD